MSRDGDSMDKAGPCVFQDSFPFIWAVKYRRKVLFGPVEVLDLWRYLR